MLTLKCSDCDGGERRPQTVLNQRTQSTLGEEGLMAARQNKTCMSRKKQQPYQE